MNRDAAARRCVGPICWDVDGGDWRYSQRNEELDKNRPTDYDTQVQQAFDACVARYRAGVAAKRRGIILFHDNHHDSFRRYNRTFEFVQQLLGMWRHEGYRFIRLDEVPVVRTALQVQNLVAIKARGTGRYFSAQRGGGGTVLANGRHPLGAWERFGMIDLGENAVAFRTAKGNLLTVEGGDGDFLKANRWEIGSWESFQLHPHPLGGIALRGPNGRYVSPQRGRGCKIKVDGPAMDTCEPLVIEYLLPGVAP